MLRLGGLLAPHFRIPSSVPPAPQERDNMKILPPAPVATPSIPPIPAPGLPPTSEMTGDDNPDTLPQLLSQTGLYTNIASPSRQVTAGIHPFTVNAPLWSDGAHKTRWVQVPEGK